QPDHGALADGRVDDAVLAELLGQPAGGAVRAANGYVLTQHVDRRIGGQLFAHGAIDGLQEVDAFVAHAYTAAAISSSEAGGLSCTKRSALSMTSRTSASMAASRLASRSFSFSAQVVKRRMGSLAFHSAISLSSRYLLGSPS